ncbi:MAG TPA: heavy metal translocating P-type ATPase [Stellaceae bacterium]|nr:heavy metal translocating P-type ATPase [Stellaceae bacterium]
MASETHMTAVEAGAAAKARDPVCGMRVDRAAAKHRHTHDGADYFFCGARCREKFMTEPERYLASATAAPAAPAAVPAAAHGGAWTCPMHPEVTADAAGPCPLCGMALEPVAAAATDNPELADMTRRFWIGAVFALPLVVLAMTDALPPSSARWIEFLLASPVVLWAGAPFFARAVASVRNRALNMFSLIGLGVAIAYAESVAVTLKPDLFPGGGSGVYYESAAVIVVLVLLGQVLELRAREGTRGAIRALMNLAPKTARRIAADGHEDEVPVAQIRVGDVLRVRPGESVPADGVVTDGKSAVDEAMVTGEWLPAEKGPGEHVIGGTLNGIGALVMRAEKVGAETMLARIVALVAEAQRSRAPIQRLADRVAAWFVPAVVTVSVLAFAAWLLWGPAPALPHALLAAVSVLIIACPCALGLATPMSIMVGVGRGARAGILVKNAAALEQLERVDTLVIDKTGTLTEGKPRLVATVPAPGADDTALLALAASLEAPSEHPVGAAIVAAAKAAGVTLDPVTEFVAHTGKGISGKAGGREAAIGNARLMREIGVDVSALTARADALGAEGASVVHVALERRFLGIVAVADPVKASSAAALQSLRADGVRVVMLTGDTALTARAVAQTLGIAEFEAELLPDAKQKVVRRLSDEGRIVAMAGDGINDAPALASADVGIAMGTGADIAIASAAVALVKGDLAALVRARRLSRATMRNIRQNLVLAFLYNALGIPIAAGVLYPVTGMLLSPMIAAAAMSLSSVSVVANALRLRFARLE